MEFKDSSSILPIVAALAGVITLQTTVILVVVIVVACKYHRRKRSKVPRASIEPDIQNRSFEERNEQEMEDQLYDEPAIERHTAPGRGQMNIQRNHSYAIPK